MKRLFWWFQHIQKDPYKNKAGGAESGKVMGQQNQRSERCGHMRQLFATNCFISLLLYQFYTQLLKEVKEQMKNYVNIFVLLFKWL